MKTLHLGITSNCNLDCQFCYNTAQGQLSVVTIDELLRTHQPETICLGGGEPGLHPDFEEILKLSTDNSNTTIISTNGTFLYSQVIDSRDEDKIVMQVSLPTVEQSLYQKITRSGADVEEIVHNALEYQKKFVAGINIPLYQDNLPSLEETVSHMRLLGFPVRISLAVPMGKGSSIRILDKKQVKELYHYVLAQRVHDKNIHFTLPEVCPGRKMMYETPDTNSCSPDCDAQDHRKIYVSPDGKAWPCEFWPGKIRVPVEVK